MLLENSPSNTGYNWKPLRSDLYAVILAGDASVEDFDHLHSVLRQVFTRLPPGWLKDSINPAAVSAIGAAMRGRHMVENPEAFRVHVQYIPSEHGEL